MQLRNTASNSIHEQRQRAFDATVGPGAAGSATQPMLQTMVERAVAEIAGAKYAGVTTAVFPAQLETVAMTHPYPALVDAIQQHQRQGPTLSARWRHDILRVNDLADDTRWPDYQREVLRATPIRSLLGFRLFTTADEVGVLTLYSDRPGAFDRRAEEIGYVVATYIAAEPRSDQPVDDVSHMITDVGLVGKAKTVLMERFRIDQSAALEMLKRLSLSSDSDLMEISRQVIAKATQL